MCSRRDPVRRPGPQSEVSTPAVCRAALSSLRSWRPRDGRLLDVGQRHGSSARYAQQSHGEKRPVHRSTYRTDAPGVRGGPAEGDACGAAAGPAHRGVSSPHGTIAGRSSGERLTGSNSELRPTSRVKGRARSLPKGREAPLTRAVTFQGEHLVCTPGLPGVHTCNNPRPVTRGLLPSPQHQHQHSRYQAQLISPVAHTLVTVIAGRPSASARPATRPRTSVRKSAALATFAPARL